MGDANKQGDETEECFEERVSREQVHGIEKEEAEDELEEEE